MINLNQQQQDRNQTRRNSLSFDKLVQQVKNRINQAKGQNGQDRQNNNNQSFRQGR